MAQTVSQPAVYANGLMDRNNVQYKSQELLLVYADWFVGYILIFTVHQLSLELQLHELFLAVVVL